MDQISYALGLNIGQQLAQMGAEELNADDFAAAVKDVLAGVNQKYRSKKPVISFSSLLKNRKKSNAKLPKKKARRQRPTAKSI